MKLGKPMWKRILILFGALFFLFVVGAISIPFFVNVDKYRTQVVSLANEHLNGELKLGKLSLSLWGQIRVQVDGFSIHDAKGRSVVSAKDVFFHIPFLPILSGSPVVVFKMTQPEVEVIADKAGKLNLLALMKPKDQQSAAPSTAPSERAATKPVEVPTIVTRARLGVEMRQAHLTYRDLAKDLVSEIKDLNVILRDLSLSRPSSFEIGATLDVTMGKTMKVSGPFAFTGTANSIFDGSRFKSSAINWKLDLDQISVVMPGVFEKAKGILANASGEIAVTPENAEVKSMDLKFHNAELKGTFKADAINSDAPQINLSLRSNAIPLKPWSELIIPLKAYELEGNANFSAKAWGNSNQPQYSADFELKDGTAKAPNLKLKPQFSLGAKIVTDKVEKFWATLIAPGSEIKIDGQLSSFKAPDLKMSVISPKLDLDAMIDFPPPAAKSAPTAPAAKPASGAVATGASDFDKMLDPLRENEIAAKTTAAIDYQFANTKAYHVVLGEMAGQIRMKELSVDFDLSQLKVFSGAIKLNSKMALKPKIPTYQANFSMSGLNIQQAVESQFALFKNTLLGRADFAMQLTGASFNPDAAKKNLNAKGNMKVADAVFATIDVAKMASEAVTKSLGQIADKVPQLRGQQLGAIQQIESKYQWISADFTIQNGSFQSPNFIGKAIEKKGIDVNGATQVSLLDYGLKANWELVDTYNLTRARDLNVNLGGLDVPHVLADGDQPVKLPVVVTGSCFEPKISYASVPAYLSEIAFKNVQKAATGRAKAEAQKVVNEQRKKIESEAKSKIGDALKGLGGSLFGN